MEEMFLGFITWQFLFFCIAIGAIVAIFRRVIEFVVGPYKEHKFWRDLILPSLPIILGQIMALSITSYPYPEQFTSTGGRFIFGLVAGFSSSFIVRMYKSFLSIKMSELTDKLKSLLASISSKEKPKD